MIKKSLIKTDLHFDVQVRFSIVTFYEIETALPRTFPIGIDIVKSARSSYRVALALMMTSLLPE